MIIIAIGRRTSDGGTSVVPFPVPDIELHSPASEDSSSEELVVEFPMRNDIFGDDEELLLPVLTGSRRQS